MQWLHRIEKEMRGRESVPSSSANSQIIHFVYKIYCKQHEVNQNNLYGNFEMD